MDKESDWGQADEKGKRITVSEITQEDILTREGRGCSTRGCSKRCSVMVQAATAGAVTDSLVSSSRRSVVIDAQVPGTNMDSLDRLGRFLHPGEFRVRKRASIPN